MSSTPRKPPRSSARELQPSTRFATRVCEPETWLLFKALAALVILASSLPGTWDSELWLSDADTTRKSWRKIWAHTCTSTLPPGMPHWSCSVWAELGRFLRQEPVARPWDDS